MTHHPATSQTAATQDTRSAVLAEALRLFADRGYTGATVRDISDASGVTTPVIYYHFGSKEGLYEAVKLHLRSLSQTLNGPASDGPFDLAGEVIRMFEFCREHPSLLRIRSWARLEGDGPRANSASSEPVAALGRRIAAAQQSGLLRDDLDADNLASMLVGLVLFRIEHRPTDADLDADWLYVRQAIALLQRGLTPQPD
jgi:TetR/AcrR family transcriptional regulator